MGVERFMVISPGGQRLRDAERGRGPGPEVGLIGSQKISAPLEGGAEPDPARPEARSPSVRARIATGSGTQSADAAIGLLRNPIPGIL